MRSTGWATVQNFEGVLRDSVIDFVDNHVRSLLAWDIVMYFHRNPDTVLSAEDLAAELGRSADEVGPEVELMCDQGLVRCDAAGICYEPSPALEARVAEFVEACQDRGQRLALIAMVLQRIGTTPGSKKN
jgi:hypothetical protein